MKAIAVNVVGAPGYADFPATLVLAGYPAVDTRGPLSVVQDLFGELHVIPSSFVVLGTCRYHFGCPGTAVTVLDCGPAIDPVPACEACAAFFERMSS